MIQPIQSNSINFKSANLSPALKAKVEAQKTQPQERTENNFSVTETYQKGKKGVIGFLKGVNNVTGITSGAARGLAEGIGVTAITGVVGKAISEAKNETGLKVIGSIISNTAKDLAHGAWETIKFIPSIITKSPLENSKTLLSLPKKFYANSYTQNGKTLKGYLSGHKAIAGITVAAGLAVLSLRTIQGKINANMKNADLEHKTNTGHV